MKFRLTLAVAAVIAFASMPSASAFVVDGIIGASDNYSDFYIIGLKDEQTGDLYQGTLALGQGSNEDGTGGANDVFALLQVPTDIHDLTWGVNSSPGWDGSDKTNSDGEIAYSKPQGSEKWMFEFDGEKVEVKMKDKDSDGIAPGYELKEDGAGAVLSASTSLDYNLSNYPGLYTVDSPACGSTLGSPTSDQDCYDNVDPAAADWIFAQQYEIQFDGGLFASGDLLAGIAQRITNTEIHASPRKGSDNGSFFLPCLDGGDCDPVDPTDPTDPPTAMAEPGSFGLLLTGLIGVFGACRRRVSG